MKASAEQGEQQGHKHKGDGCVPEASWRKWRLGRGLDVGAFTR